MNEKEYGSFLKKGCGLFEELAKEAEEKGENNEMLTDLFARFKQGSRLWKIHIEIDWEAVLEVLQDELREKMKLERGCDIDDERNPYTFPIFDLQGWIGFIEQGRYEEAYTLLSEEYGEEFFEDFIR